MNRDDAVKIALAALERALERVHPECTQEEAAGAVSLRDAAAIEIAEAFSGKSRTGVVQVDDPFPVPAAAPAPGMVRVTLNATRKRTAQQRTRAYLDIPAYIANNKTARPVAGMAFLDANAKSLNWIDDGETVSDYTQHVDAPEAQQ